MSTLKVNALTNVAGNADITNVGKILQVIQAVKTDTASFNSTSFADIAGLSATITPSSNSNKVLVIAHLYIASNANNGSRSTTKLNFVRGSTNIGQPSGSVNHTATFFNFIGALSMIPCSMNFLDSPATTSATTYKLQLAADSTSTSTFINRYSGADNYHGISTFTIMEVSA